MTAYYKVYQDKRSGGTGMYYGRCIHPSTNDLTHYADRVANNTSASRGEVLGLIKNLEALIRELLLDSYKVKLDGIGILRVSPISMGAATEGDFKPSEHFKGVRLRGYCYSDTTEAKTRAGDGDLSWQKASGA